MKLSIIVILLFSSLIVKAQDYNEYYNGINNAKLMISQDSLKTSLSYYFQTFEKFDFVFARDCYNAIELSALAKKFSPPLKICSSSFNFFAISFIDLFFPSFK